MPDNQFRIIVGSYEHNLLCLSLNLSLSTPLFTPIFHFQAHSLSVKCLDISKRYLVSGSNDEHIRIYDLQKRKELGTLLQHQGSITNLRFSKKSLDSEDGANSGNKWLLSASDDHKINIWRVKDWENFGILKGHTARINDVDIHPSNRIAVSVGEDHTVRLWNLMTVKKAGILKLKGYRQNGQYVRFSDKGNHFIVGLLNYVLIYKTSTAKVVKDIDFGRKTLMHIEVAEIGGTEYLVVGLSTGALEFYETSELYEAKEEVKPKHTLMGHTNRIKDFEFYENEFGHYMISIGSDGKIVVWDLKSMDSIAVYDSGERLNCVAVCDESVEKYDTMKKRTSETLDVEESEVEDNTEELKKIMNGGRKKKKAKGKNSKITVDLE